MNRFLLQFSNDWFFAYTEPVSRTSCTSSFPSAMSSLGKSLSSDGLPYLSAFSHHRTLGNVASSMVRTPLLPVSTITPKHSLGQLTWRVGWYCYQSFIKFGFAKVCQTACFHKSFLLCDKIGAIQLSKSEQPIPTYYKRNLWTIYFGSVMASSHDLNSASIFMPM